MAKLDEVGGGDAGSSFKGAEEPISKLAKLDDDGGEGCGSLSSSLAGGSGWPMSKVAKLEDDGGAGDSCSRAGFGLPRSKLWNPPGNWMRGEC